MINTCFSALLAEAYGRGGSLLKFGGDAMLLLFYDQEGDQQHAVAGVLRGGGDAAHGCVTSAGSAPETANVVLRMSVGVHSGAYAMFVVGGSHREIVIGGPAASTVVALEAAASSGQILISPDTARRLPRALRGPPVGPGLLLGRSPPRCAWVPPAGLPSSAREVDRELLAGGGPRASAERIGGPRASDRDDRVPAVRRPRRGAGRETGRAARRGGSTSSCGSSRRRSTATTCASSTPTSPLDGGKIRLSAGAPRVVGDDEERMLLALRHIVEAGPPLPLRVGVHRGPVFTGTVGPAYRRWYAVMGDTVNLAARLVAKAPAGHVYATREVLRRGEDQLRADRARAVRGQGQVAAGPGVGRRAAAPRRLGRRRSGWSCR